MVDPARRRRGIGSALLSAALSLCVERSEVRPLLVVPRVSPGGQALAKKYDCVLHHSEHALVLRQAPAATATRSRQAPGALGLREATAADFDALSSLMLDGFGYGETDREQPLVDNHTRTLMVTLADVVIGTIRLTRDGERAGVYGFVIASEHRGLGLGATVLRTVCDQLFRSGARVVGLEVAVDNERALRLYTDLGFQPVTTEDYYELQ